MMVAAKQQAAAKPTERMMFDRASEEITLCLPSSWDLSWRQISELGELNEHCRFERSEDGRLIVTGTPPMTADWIEQQLRVQIGIWMREGGGGLLRGAAGGYTLPDSSLRVPYLSWIPDELVPPRGDREAWDAEPVLVPPFVVEIRSRRQSLASQQRKMERFIANGVRLGWLFDPRHRQVHVYRPGREAAQLDSPESLSGEDVMVGLTVDLTDIWP